MSDILLYSAHILGVTPLLIFLGFRVKRKFLNGASRQVLPISLLMALSTIVELAFTPYWLSNDIWFRLFSLLEFYTVAWFFASEFKGRYKKLINVFYVILTAIWLAVTLWVPLKVGSDMLISLPETFFTFILVFLWFKDIFQRLQKISLLDSFSFYFVAGITFYLACSMFVGILQKQISDNEDLLLSDLWKINVVAVLIARMLFNISAWKAAKSN